MSEKIDLVKEDKTGSNYELTLILSEEKEIAIISELVKSCGGEIKKEESLGLKRLAYEIKKHKEGYYFRITFHCPRENVAKMNDELSREKNIIRYLIVSALRESGEASKHQRTAREGAQKQPTQVIEKPQQEVVEEPEKTLAKKEEFKQEIVELPQEEVKPKVEKKTVEASEKKEKAGGEDKKAKASAKRVTKKASKADASDLDKKLEELVKED
ncbi:MAG: 30S ribosomal protein S6 [candidate division WS2 bacterium ADurb.Bin280]|uniref:Small ribosomal subunit protein bS6 n=1 Tax=candidate division WS2 bacterium ADurb.Bin280 TaxID=1852829 RepID=A0A1V5SBV8_9BACT|nr:MAG: 30S ribosomal protein S6 [candidate division WS2 bacterium ADurb.Bin280]